jgi:Putative beta-barrel porin-2, OmpL-like. bbp2
MPRALKSALLPALCAGTYLSLAGGYARAAEVAPAPPLPNWWDTFTLSGIVDAGITANVANPPDGLNFGHLFTDRANAPLLNQILLTAQRPIDPKATGYDIGFKVQVMYGSDARYAGYLGECDYCIASINQFTPVEAWAELHTPWLFPGGIDIKAGQWVTLEGAETIDPTTNYTYTKSYIFNFGIPLDETGVLTISHVSPLVDIYAGVDTGVNTSIGYRGGDDNGAVSFVGGIGFNLLDGNLTILATTHIGPELPDTFAERVACGCDPNTALRFLNDVVTTWKVNDRLTLINDANFIHDDGFNTSGYGMAQYAVYTVNDWLKLVGRAEIWRDDGLNGAGFWVAGFPSHFDFKNSEWGFPNSSFVETPTTYLELTGALNISPEIPKGTPIFQSVVIRPEIRYDRSLNGTTPFGGSNGLGFAGSPGFGVGTSSGQFTFGGDIVLKFGT